MKYENKKSQRHPEFPSGLPSKYYPGPTLLNYSDLMRTGVFTMVFWLVALHLGHIKSARLEAKRVS